MDDNPNEFAKRIADKYVDAKFWDNDEARVATIERVNSSHPSMYIGIFVNYRNTPDEEWITPRQFADRIESEQWTPWDGGA